MTDSDLPTEVREALADPPNDLGRFVRVRLLGEGGMGKVWLAWEKSLGRFVALKFVHAGEDAGRIVREARTAAKLDHPHILPVYEVCEIGGQPAIVMKYVQGASLRGAHLDLARTLRVMRDVALALHYAHQRGVIHRDIKPDNILVEPPERVFVSDFGLAKQQSAPSSLSGSGVILGTPSFMPPEQARGREDEIDARSDVYSIGATLYAALAGVPPFDGQSAYELLERVVRDEPAPPRRYNPAIPREVELIVLKAMAKDRARRYATAEELAEDLRRYLQGEPVLARPASITYRFKKRVMRNPAFWMAVAAIAVLVTAATTALVLAGRARARERRADELSRAALELLKEGKELWRIKTARRDAWEAKFSESESRARAAIDLAPGLPGGFYALGEVQRARGQWEEAVRSFDRALELNPRSGDARYRRGLCAIELYLETIIYSGPGEMAAAPGSSSRATAEPLKERALEDLRAYAQERGPGSDADLRYAQAVIAFAEGRYDDATRACEALLNESRTDERVWLLKGRIEIDGRRPEAAVRVFDDLIDDVMPLSFAAFHQRGRAKLSLGRYREASDDFQRAIGLNPSFAPSHYQRGYSRAMVDDWKGAVEDCTSAIGLAPRYARAHSTRGWARAHIGEEPDGLEDCARAIELDSRLALAFVDRGFVRARMKDLQGAVEDYDRAIAIDPRYARAFLNRGSARAAMGDQSGAAADYTEALRIVPSYDLALSNRMMARGHLRDWKGVVDDATALMELKADHPSAWSHRGWAKINLADYAGAEKDLIRAAELSPSSAIVFNNRAWARTGLKKWPEVVEDASKAIDLDRKLSTAWLHRGRARLNQGDAPGAIADLSQALDLNPGYALALNLRGRARMAAEDYRGARDDLLKAIELESKYRPELEPLLQECESKIR